MDLFEIIAWINFFSLNGIAFLTFFFYTLSVMPISREKKIGQKAWKDCVKFRLISDILWFVLIIMRGLIEIIRNSSYFSIT